MGKKFKANTGEQSKRITNLQDYIKLKDDEAYRFLLNDEKGRWFISRLLRAEGLVATSFTGNSATFYNEGRRAVVIAIRNKIEELGKAEYALLHKAEDELYEAEHYLEKEMDNDAE